MGIDLIQFYERLKDYPGSYLTPAEQDAFDQVLAALTNLVGYQIRRLNREAQIQFVKNIVEVCVKTLHPEEREKE